MLFGVYDPAVRASFDRLIKLTKSVFEIDEENPENQTV